MGLDGVSDPSADDGMDETEDVGIIFRHSGWMPRRTCVERAIGGLDNAQNRLTRFQNCGRNCWVLRSLDEPGVYRISCDRCKDRFCGPCSQERARRVASCVGEYAKGKELRLITLTLRKSARSLSDDVDFLYKSFTRLRRRKLWKRGQHGGVYFVEIKRRRGDDGWHVHLHILSEGAYLSKSLLSKTWLEITGDSFIVDIKFCRSGEDAARYVAKYASKGVHGSCYHDADVLREAILAIKGRRLVGKYGTWKELVFDNDMLPGEWVGVDSLRRLIARSANGDAVASSILFQLKGDDPCNTEPRSPPHPGGSQCNYETNPDALGVPNSFNLAS